MKKLLSVLLVLVMTFTLLASCGGGKEEGKGDMKDDKKVEKKEDKKDDKKEEKKEESGFMVSEEAKGQEVVLYQNKVEIGEALLALAKKFEEETGIKATVKTSGGDSPYAELLKSEFQSDRQPDLFVVEGLGGYKTWESKLEPFEGEDWIDVTDLEFVVDGKIYGFPVAVEAWGMAYNKDILDKAGVDPATLTSQEGYKAAFEKIDGMKDELGLKSVVAMAAGPDMRWVTGLHNFNGYLASGLEYGDRSVLEQMLAGEPNMERLEGYADWVELLFMYADKGVLLTGNYDAQVGQFATGQAAFIHQGNWIDPWLAENGVNFNMGYAPHASVKGEATGIFIGAPSYYVLNKDSANKEAAKAFLNYIAMTETGHKYMVEEAKMIPAFSNVELVPKAPLSSSVVTWMKNDAKTWGTWLQNDMPDGFGMGTLGPIYEAFAKGDIDKQGFIDQVSAKIKELK